MDHDSAVIAAGQIAGKMEKETFVEDLASQLRVSSETGLSEAEAENRLARYGYNELAEERTNPFVDFLSHFWGPIPWMIEAAVILSALLGDRTDFAIIVVLLALLNDGAILSIAYDAAPPSRKPVAWNMYFVLGLATVLGTAGVIASFGLFYLAESVFQLDGLTIQSLIYLKLSVAGHLTIFITRTREPFWSHRRPLA